MYIIYVYIIFQVIHDTQSAQVSQKQGGRNIYVIMKTMCPYIYIYSCNHELNVLSTWLSSQWI